MRNFSLQKINVEITMMKKKSSPLFIYSLFLLVLFAQNIFSQEKSEQIDSLFNSITDIENRLKTIEQKEFVSEITIPDSLEKRKPNGTIIFSPHQSYTPLDASLTFRDTMFYNPLFLPIIFNGNILEGKVKFWNYIPFAPLQKKNVLINSQQTFAPKLRHQQFIQHIRNNYYVQNPEKIALSIYDLKKIPEVASDREVIKQYNPFKELISTEMTASMKAPDVDMIETKRIYWIKSGEHSLQFSQNYFSNNWHKSGTSNLNINNFHILRANYKKEKVRFNNSLEWRLSLFNAPEDSLREVRIGEDLIRYYGDFGLDAYKKTWSYSANLEAKSQIFHNHSQNSNELRSAFLAPLYVNAGLGMKYSIDKKSKKIHKRRTRLEIAMAPLSMNLKYIGNEKINPKRYGIPEGKSSILDFGSTVTAIFTYDYNRNITWHSRFKYFTSYEKVESEFENSLNMALSRFLSTRIYLNVRFDDSVPPDSEYRYFQVHETLSFGLNYKW